MQITMDDGVGLVVDDAGAGPPLVMLHGFTGASDDFADHRELFARHSRVVTFDHRGHGGSGKPVDLDAYSLDRLAADTLAVADALELERFRLLGHSMGGMVARRVVMAAPARIDALVLMDTSTGSPEGIDPAEAEMAGELALTEGMDVLRALLDEVQPLRTEADRRVRAERPGYEEFDRRKWQAVPPAAYAALVREIVRQADELDALCAAVRCPTLVIVGEQDEPFLRSAARMADAIPGAELAVIPDAGHSPQFENPDVWFGVLDAFLRALPVEAAA